MSYVAKWSDLPEVEILKGNFRRSASGLKGSVNKIRLSHPSETPVHHHAEEEQTVLMLSGEMDVVIDKDTISQYRWRSGVSGNVFAGAHPEPDRLPRQGFLGRI